MSAWNKYWVGPKITRCINRERCWAKANKWLVLSQYDQTIGYSVILFPPDDFLSNYCGIWAVHQPVVQIQYEKCIIFVSTYQLTERVNLQDYNGPIIPQRSGRITTDQGDQASSTVWMKCSRIIIVYLCTGYDYEWFTPSKHPTPAFKLVHCLLVVVRLYQD